MWRRRVGRRSGDREVVPLREAVDVAGPRPPEKAERTVVEREWLFAVGGADGDVVDRSAGRRRGPQVRRNRRPKPTTNTTTMIAGTTVHWT